MKFRYVCWSVCIMLFCIASPAFSQQVNYTTIPLGAPLKMNFRQTAYNERQNPQPQSQRFIEQGEDKREEQRRHHFKHPLIGADAKTFNVVLAENVMRTVSPSPNLNVDGTPDNGNLIPPDIDGAAGPDYIMETTNQQYDIYDKAGNLIDAMSINAFFTGTGGTNSYFDPHVEYDAQHNRWIVLSDGAYTSNNHSALFIGISQTDDPTGDWYIYSYDAIGNANDFLDFPAMGFNVNWIVVTGNNFLSNGNTNTKIYVFNRADLYAGNAGTVHTYTDASIFSLCPAETNNLTTNTEYMVTDWDGSNAGFGYVKLFKITGTATNPAYSAGSTVGVNQPWSENTQNAPQLGSTHDIEVGDTRIYAAVIENGQLWFAHSVGLPSNNPNRTAADWWQIDPVNATLTQFGRLDDASGNVFYYYPSISVNSLNDALMGYTISSASMHPGCQYSYHDNADAPGSLQDGYLYKAGTASYYETFGGNRNRWGDFSGTFTDPADNSFWTIQEYATSPVNTWATRIANVGGVPCNATPEAGFITASLNPICPGEITTLDLWNYTSSVLGIELQWQQSNDGNTWSNSTGFGATTKHLISGALNQTTYFRCIVTCSNTGQSDTTTVLIVSTGGSLNITNDTVCTPGINQIIVSGVGTANWYLTDTSSVAFFTGNSLSYDVTGDTTFYVSANSSSNSTVGIPNSTNGSYYSANYGNGLVFSATSNFMLDSVYVYPNSTGQVKVILYDYTAGMNIDSVTVNINSAQVNTKRRVVCNFSITGGGIYNLNALGTNVSGLYRTSSGATYPYSIPGVMSIDYAINQVAGYYYFFYDWHIHSGCATDMQPVNIHLGDLTLSAIAEDDTICFADHTNLLAAATSNTGTISYLWQPGALTGDSININPSFSTTYTVTATDGYCSSNTTLHITVINCTTGIAGPDQHAYVTLYPNPTHGFFDLQFTNIPSGKYNIEVMNAIGQKILELTADIAGENKVIPVDLSLLPNGVYYVRVSDEHQQWLNSIAKQ